MRLRAEIEKALAARVEKLEITAERVLVAIADIAFGDVRDVLDADCALKAPSEWDERTAASVVGLEIGTSAKGKGEVVHVAKIRRADWLRACWRGITRFITTGSRSRGWRG
jgi:phage terminase small subunit